MRWYEKTQSGGGGITGADMQDGAGGKMDRMDKAQVHGKEKYVSEENLLREEIRKLAGSGGLTQKEEKELLNSIHSSIDERRKIMKQSGYRKIKVAAAAAAIAVLGVGTAFASGKIASLSSSTRTDQVDYKNAQEVEVSDSLYKKARAVDEFSNGAKFVRGFDVNVSAQDENGVEIGTYPSISIDYSGEYFLDISDPLEGAAGQAYPAVLSETYEDVEIEVSVMDYLFLPPDQEPDEADLKLEEEGKLEISYGTDKAERKTSIGAFWEDDGLTYCLITMKEGGTPEELLQMAKEIIAK